MPRNGTYTYKVLTEADCDGIDGSPGTSYVLAAGVDLSGCSFNPQPMSIFFIETDVSDNETDDKFEYDYGNLAQFHESVKPISGLNCWQFHYISEEGFTSFGTGSGSVTVTTFRAYPLL